MSQDMNTKQVKIGKRAVLKWLPAKDLKVSHEAQRDFKQSRADKIAANFNEDEFGTLTVNSREGSYYLIDGQHRCSGAIQVFGEDVLVPCWVYEDLSIEEEAEKFLVLNDMLPVHAMDKFHVGVTAGRRTEVEVERIAREHGLTIGHNVAAGGVVAAIAKLTKIYERDGEDVLQATFKTILESFGDVGLGANMLGGIALLHARYPEIDQERLISKLSSVRGGSNGVLGLARQVQLGVKKPISECVAAVCIQQYNKGLRGRAALPAWWKE